MAFNLLLLVTFLLPPSMGSTLQQRVTDEMKCFEQFCLPPDYNKHVGPFKESGRMEISADFDVSQVVEIDDVNFNIRFIMYIGLTWVDPRIVSLSEDEDQEAWIPVDIEFGNHIWLPDLYIYDLKEILFPKYYKIFAGIWLINTTTVYYTQETQITFWCRMRFHLFPLDIQVCHFRIGSFAFNLSQITFKTQKLFYNKKVRNTVLDYAVEVTDLNEQEMHYVWEDIGNYSLAGYQLKLERNSLKYIFNYYLPSGLFVVVSWASFLIPYENVSSRMTLLVTLSLVQISIFNTVIDNSPNVEGLSPITAWLLVCILFVFGALVAFTCILFKRYWMSCVKITAESPVMPTKESLKMPILPRMDKIYLILFPLVFVIFNIIYWPICFYAIQQNTNTTLI